MKKKIFVYATLLAMVACTNNKQVTAVENNEENNEIVFEAAKNYFYNHNVGLPSPKITTEKEFRKYFGMATTMSTDGKPTAIDFSKQFVLDIVLPASEWLMEITPVKVMAKGDTLLYYYQVKVGQKQSFQSQPISIIIIDKENEKQGVVLVNEQDITYNQAIDRYLVNEIGTNYTQSDYCVPFYNIIDTDEDNTDDIKVWGDFWVLNYNQVSDTLKCVSGGNHPGLMHIRQTEKGFQVTAFDQVADGSDNMPSAKRIFGNKYNSFQAINSDEGWREQMRIDKLADYAMKHKLTATMYQDFGRPAKRFRNVK